MPNQGATPKKHMRPDELREVLIRNTMFLEGMSYCLPEEAGRQMRKRLNNQYDLVNAFLKQRFPEEFENASEERPEADPA